MANQSAIVFYDAAQSRHLPLPAGDKIDPSRIPFQPTALSFNSGTGDLTATFADGSTQVASLSSLDADKFLASSSFNPTTAVLTLTMTDASVYTVNLSDLFKIVTAAGNGTAITGDGTTATPLKVDQNAVAAAAVATGDDGTLPTDVYTSTGAVANFLLGDPEGFATFYVGGVAKKVPYYA